MRGVRTALLFACGLTLATACGGPTDTPGTPTGATTLATALGRIAATEETRTSVLFDASASLTDTAGDYDDLLGHGSAGLAKHANQEHPGIALDQADYTITAGLPPRSIGLVAGGQDTTRITSELIDLGWREDQGLLTAPNLTDLTEKRLAPLALELATARAEDGDLVYGSAKANLEHAGQPTGQTLADDPRISALSDCLGDVVAATVATPDMTGALHPTAVAVGVRAPAANTDTPHVAACLTWNSDDDANQYRTLLDRALREGTSTVTAKPWTDMLADVTVEQLGGKEHVVAWEADTRDNRPTLILSMLNRLDLPAFPCHPQMTPQMRAKVADYC